MTVGQLIRKGLFGVLNSGNEDSVINNVFSCDLLSLAMTKDLDGCAWFTVIGNVNTIAVAAHTGASCVVLCEKVKPDADALLKAQEHNIALFVSDKPVFDSAAEQNERFHKLCGISHLSFRILRLPQDKRLFGEHRKQT